MGAIWCKLNVCKPCLDKVWNVHSIPSPNAYDTMPLVEALKIDLSVSSSEENMDQAS